MIIELDEWQRLADILREEIQEYGWLLNLLDSQQQTFLQRDAEKFPEITHSLEDQIQTVLRTRSQREELTKSVKATLGLETETTLRPLISQMPEGLQELFEALMEEARNLLQKLHRLCRENQLLFVRASHVAREFLRLLAPKEFSTTYTARKALHTNNRTIGARVHFRV